MVLLLAGSFQVFAQDASSSLIVVPPIHTNGNAQAAVVGLTPSQIRHAYGFDQITTNQGAGQTIALVEAFGDPQIEKDLAIFNEQFNLPPCTTSNGCFQKISSNGKNLGTDQLWALETALDVEWAHAIAPQAQIMLVEAPSNILSVMLGAVDFAVSQGATVVSMSWGGLEFAGENALDSHFLAANVSFVAASGDFGTGLLYPAASPFVTAVGGTTLTVDAQGNYVGETAWSGSGGGITGFESVPPYQVNITNGPATQRGNPDVAYNADPNSGFAVFTTVSIQGFNGWIQVGGTSAGAPQWAALVAIANSMRVQAQKSPLTGSDLLTGTNADLYAAAATKKSYAANYHDITSGSNGACGVLCTAIEGYDFVTGLGSPRVQSLIGALVSAP